MNVPHTQFLLFCRLLPTERIPFREEKGRNAESEKRLLPSNRIRIKKQSTRTTSPYVAQTRSRRKTVRVQICISSQISSSLPLLATYAADRFIRAISPPHLRHHSANGTGREEGIHLAKKKFASVCRVPPTSNPRIASRNAVCLPPSCHFCKPASSFSSNQHSPTVGREMATCQTGAPCGGGRRRAKMGGC